MNDSTQCDNSPAELSLDNSPTVVVNLDQELLTLCLSETLSLLARLALFPSPEVQRLAAQARLRVAYHLLHSSTTSSDSELRLLARTRAPAPCR